MERVTFREEQLVARIGRTCVPTWTNVLPGFETASIDRFVGFERVIMQRAEEQPGAGASNVATVFSMPDGRVLHVAPGFHTASQLERELDFALSVRDAIRAAGDDLEAQDRAAAAAHEGRRREPELAYLARVHETLAARRLSVVSLRRADYTDQQLDEPATLLQGKGLLESSEPADRRRCVEARAARRTRLTASSATD